jgi:hypothetical protein
MKGGKSFWCCAKIKQEADIISMNNITAIEIVGEKANKV